MGALNLRLVSTHTGKRKGFSAKVYRDVEWQEHRVKFYQDGKHLTNADFHTDDKQDAVDTANFECNREI